MQLVHDSVFLPHMFKKADLCSTFVHNAVQTQLIVWWCWLVQQFPLNIAPNLITVIGLLVNVLTSLLLVYFSPYADQEVPRWACFLCCLGLFVYQSLDAIDGKQARRTNSQSPLGELFDHGCDSLSTLFVSVSVCCAVQLGKRPYWLFCQCMMAVTLFYCAHWQTYVSGKLRFGRVDVTEAQFGVMLILLISTVFGSSFWSYQVPVLGLTLQCLPTIFGFIAGSIALFNNFQVIFVERGAGRNGSTVALLLGVPLMDVLCLLCLLYQAGHVLYQLSFAVLPGRGAGHRGASLAVCHFDVVVASGGAVVASGGAVVASGGAVVASGGAVVASGGAVVASGGAVVASGGAVVASGGAVVASGGAVAASGGAVVASGGFVADAFDTSIAADLVIQ
ncbi:CDP-alcohol phosphatidyltransferase [Trinorchestia longiramus]|nr:CDP-alcohol phosphatidyltransferase [Trinorchestia longiramus]